MNELFKKIGNRIREQREKSGMTQEELSEAADLSQNFLSLIENGRRGPSINTINRISSVLGLPIHVFFQFSAVKDTDKNIIKKYESLISSLNKKEQVFLSDVIKETAFKLKKLRKKT